MRDSLLLFDEQEEKLIQSYIMYIFGFSQSREIVGKSLAMAAKKNENSAFTNIIAALFTIYESKELNEKAKSFLDKQKTIDHPVLKLSIDYILNNDIIRNTGVDNLDNLVLQYIKENSSFEERLDSLNVLLTFFVAKELSWESYKCPICEFIIPRPCIRQENDNRCIKCGTKLQFDTETLSFRSISSMNKSKQQIIPETVQDLSSVAKDVTDPIEMAQLAMAFYNKGKIEEALKYLDEAVNISEENEVLSIGSRIYFEIGDYDRAIVLLEKLEADDPENTQLLGMMATTYSRLDLNQEAVARLKRILEFEPENETAISLLENLEDIDYSDW